MGAPPEQPQAVGPTPQAPAPLRNTLPRSERLHLKRLADQLFQKGRRAFAYPYRGQYLVEPQSDEPGLVLVVVVPKRVLKLATDRNAQKRRIREAYRLNAHPLRQYALEHRYRIVVGILLIANETLPWRRGHRAVVSILQQILKSLHGKPGKC